MKDKQTNLAAGRVLSASEKNGQNASAASASYGVGRLGITAKDACDASREQPLDSSDQTQARRAETGVPDAAPTGSRDTQPTRTTPSAASANAFPQGGRPDESADQPVSVRRGVRGLVSFSTGVAVAAGLLAMVVLLWWALSGGEELPPQVSQAAQPAPAKQTEPTETPSPAPRDETPAPRGATGIPSEWTEPPPEPLERDKPPSTRVSVLRKGSTRFRSILSRLLSGAQDAPPEQRPPRQPPSQPPPPRENRPEKPPAPPDEPTPLVWIACPSGFSLSGAFTGPDGKPRAVVNNRSVAEGDIVDGAKVVRIANFSVEMEMEGKRFSLSVSSAPPPPRKTPESAEDEEEPDKHEDEPDDEQ